MDITGAMQEAKRKLSLDFVNVDFQYEYPNGLDLHPNSPEHGALLNLILDRAEAAKRHIDQVKPEWKKINHSLEGFVPLDAAEASIKAEDSRRPVRIVIPQLFATRETFLTYLASTFLTNPIHPIEGRNTEDRLAALKLERLIQAQSNWFKEGLHCMTQWKDGLAFGAGYLEARWRRDTAQRSASIVVEDLLEKLFREDGQQLGAKVGETVRFFQDELLMEGTEWRPIDPWNSLPDPNVPVNFAKDSEFFGHGYTTNAMNLLAEEGDPDQPIFNAKFVRMAAEKGLATSRYVDSEDTGRGERWGMQQVLGAIAAPLSTRVDVVRMYLRLIPSEWGLGDDDRPQIFEFAVAGDRIIITAEKMNYNHGRIPIVTCAPNTNGHDSTPVSYLALGYGFELAANFYHTSHVTNVRKAINDMLIVDPQGVEWDDVIQPGPGKIIRLKQSAYGLGNIDQYIKQLQVTDVTQNHAADAATLIELAERTMGTTDITQGNLNNMPERPTSGGIRTAMTAALSRIQTMAQTLGMQSMNDMGYIMAFNTQQFMSVDTTVGLTGRYEDQLRKTYGDNARIPVDMREINIPFDIVPLNGTIPGKENADAWTTIMQTIFQNPELGAQILSKFETTRIFTHWAKINGAEDVTEFLKEGGDVNFQTLPDDVVAQQEQAGNLVPLGELAAA